MDKGWQIFEEVFSGQECENMLDALAMLTQTRAGARHLMRNAAVSKLANDERLLTIARQALGENAVPYRATLFAKTGRANWLVVWHQDTALPLVERFAAEGWGPWSVKEGINYAHAPTWALKRIMAMRIHLDDCTTANGPLRVIPGSHQQGVLSDDDVTSYTREHSAVECLVGRGGVLAMSPLLVHASSKAQSDAPRRVLHIEYADELALAPEIRLALA